MALDLEVRREQERIASLRQSACRLPQARLPKRRDAIVAAMRNVNSLILRLNLVRPPSVPERQPYRIADEKKRIEAEFGLAAGSSASPVLTDSSDARRLRSSARSLYAAGHPRPR
jgi:hypothetical protein